MENTPREPLISICLITYNHVNFIRQAIEGVLLQKNLPPSEFIIADDFSTDGTREIIQEYQRKYPGFICLILQPVNVGPGRNWNELLHAARGKYIAYFEGDDYWIDNFKLRKQFTFLEENTDCVYCYTNEYVMRNNDLSAKDTYVKTPIPRKHDFGFLLKSGTIASSRTTMFLREAMPSPWPPWMETIFHGDLAFQALIGQKGLFGYLDEITAVYRVHPASKINSNRNQFTSTQSVLFLLSRINELTENKYLQTINLHRSDHLEYLAFEHFKLHHWGAFVKCLVKSIWYNPFRDILSLRRGFHRFRQSFKSLFNSPHHHPA